MRLARFLILFTLSALNPVTITGNVREPKGAPVDPAVKVQVLNADGELLGTSFSDVQGRFTLQLKAPVETVILTFTRNDTDAPQTYRARSGLRDLNVGTVVVPE